MPWAALARDAEHVEVLHKGENAMPWWVWAAVIWVVLSVPVALLMAAAMRRTDEEEARWAQIGKWK